MKMEDIPVEKWIIIDNALSDNNKIHEVTALWLWFSLSSFVKYLLVT